MPAPAPDAAEPSPARVRRVAMRASFARYVRASARSRPRRRVVVTTRSRLPVDDVARSLTPSPVSPRLPAIARARALFHSTSSPSLSQIPRRRDRGDGDGRGPEGPQGRERDGGVPAAKSEGDGAVLQAAGLRPSRGGVAGVRVHGEERDQQRAVDDVRSPRGDAHGVRDRG